LSNSLSDVPTDDTLVTAERLGQLDLTNTIGMIPRVLRLVLVLESPYGFDNHPDLLRNGYLKTVRQWSGNEIVHGTIVSSRRDNLAGFSPIPLAKVHKCMSLYQRQDMRKVPRDPVVAQRQLLHQCLGIRDFH
jgi:hypothetical protein